MPAELSVGPTMARSRSCIGSRSKAGRLTVSCCSRPVVKMAQLLSGMHARLTAGPSFNGPLTTTLSSVYLSPQTAPSLLALQETEF